MMMTYHSNTQLLLFPLPEPVNMSYSQKSLLLDIQYNLRQYDSICPCCDNIDGNIRDRHYEYAEIHSRQYFLTSNFLEPVPFTTWYKRNYPCACCGCEMDVER